MRQAHVRPFVPLAIVGMIFLLACGAPAPEPEAPAAEAPAAGMSQGALPEGHPPIEQAPPSSGIIPPPAGSGAGATGLGWSTPEGWVVETPSSNMRKAQYRVSGAGGDGECVVFYFGPGQGGEPMANAIRWAGQFVQPDGSSPQDAMKTEQIQVNGIPVMMIEVTGTYTGGGSMMGGPAQQIPDYMLLGAVAQGPDANWFFKFTGPEATLTEQREAFRQMVQSLQPGGEQT